MDAYCVEPHDRQASQGSAGPESCFYRSPWVIPARRAFKRNGVDYREDVDSVRIEGRHECNDWKASTHRLTADWEPTSWLVLRLQ